MPSSKLLSRKKLQLLTTQSHSKLALIYAGLSQCINHGLVRMKLPSIFTGVLLIGKKPDLWRE